MVVGSEFSYESKGIKISLLVSCLIFFFFWSTSLFPDSPDGYLHGRLPPVSSEYFWSDSVSTPYLGSGHSWSSSSLCNCSYLLLLCKS